MMRPHLNPPLKGEEIKLKSSLIEKEKITVLTDKIVCSKKVVLQRPALAGLKAPSETAFQMDANYSSFFFPMNRAILNCWTS